MNTDAPHLDEIKNIDHHLSPLSTNYLLIGSEPSEKHPLNDDLDGLIGIKNHGLKNHRRK